MDFLSTGIVHAVGYVVVYVPLMIVVAGDNLQIPLLGQFLQNAGAFYIRRAWGDDLLYATVVQAYIDILLSKGYNFECFIEGTRSRTGSCSFQSSDSRKITCPQDRNAEITLQYYSKGKGI